MLLFYFTLIVLFFIKGTSLLTCSFDNGLCGWQNPEDANKKWRLNNGSSQHIVTPYRLMSFPSTVRLIYPNFTGSGFLSFSYWMGDSSYTGPSLFVGKRRLLNLGKKWQETFEWLFATIPINSTNETVIIEGSKLTATSFAQIAVDDIVFSEKQETKCPLLIVPANVTMNCTSSNRVNSICRFRCIGINQLVSPVERRCLSTGTWSGYKVNCTLPSIRLRGSGYPMAGIVEILLGGSWNSVCIAMNEITNTEARVVCRSLGYEGQAWILKSYPYEMFRDSLVVLEGCRGDEKSIANCRTYPIKRYGCKSENILAVACGNLSCPINCQCEVVKMEYVVKCNLPATVDVLADIFSDTKQLSMNGIDLSSINPNSLGHLSSLRLINFTNTNLTKIDNQIFGQQKRIKEIYLNQNRISRLADVDLRAIELNTIRGVSSIQLSLRNNYIDRITKQDTNYKAFVAHLELHGNLIAVIEEGAFKRMVSLKRLDLSGNRITRIPANTFPNGLHTIFLQDNRISQIEDGAFQNLITITKLDLRYNRIKEISTGMLKTEYSNTLTELYLGTNLISQISDDAFRGHDVLTYLDISLNYLEKIDKHLLHHSKRVMLLYASKSNIKHIEDMAFKNQLWLYYILLDANQLRRIQLRTFYGTNSAVYVSLSNNPLETIEYGAFKHMTDLIAIFLIGTNLRTIDVGTTIMTRDLVISHSTGEQLPSISMIRFAVPFLRTVGYLCLPGTEFHFKLCFPCNQGEYKLGLMNEVGCQKCPPGGFYQDTIAHVGVIVHGLGCKQCPFGTFVSIDNAPGRTVTSCKACPRGTNLKRLAGFRACPCVDNFYRLDRFGACKECPLGYQCTNETINLHPGFYWIWSQEAEKENYLTFAEKLQTENKDHELDWRTSNGTLPSAYVCPFPSSCKGGFDANCSYGYEGILCALCSKGFYQTYSGCNKCPSLLVIGLQITAVFIILAIITFVIVKDKKSRSERSATDTIFSSFKIVIGFYQVTSGTLRAYSYIQWPVALTKLMKFADIVQLNIFKLVPIECLSHSIKITPYVGLVTYVSLDALVILLALGYLCARKVFLKMKKVNQEEMNKNLFTCKANCYRAVFLFLFVTYPATCEKVFQVLPFGCTEVCDNQNTCNWYLRSDYSVQCYTTVYNKYVILAYLALVIPVVFPLVTVIMLWKYCRTSHETNQNVLGKDDDVLNATQGRNLYPKGHEIENGLKFLYENYSSDCWYWEVTDLVRKVILTSVVVYSGENGRLFLGMSAIMSGFYSIFFAHSKPIPYMFDYWLYLGSLLATMATQLMAMLLKIPVETVSILVSTEDDSLGINVLLVFANTFVMVMIAARYVYGMLISILAIRKNPRFSLDCILMVFQVASFESGQNQTFGGKDKNDCIEKDISDVDTQF